MVGPEQGRIFGRRRRKKNQFLAGNDSACDVQNVLPHIL